MRNMESLIIELEDHQTDDHELRIDELESQVEELESQVDNIKQLIPRDIIENVVRELLAEMLAEARIIL